MNFSNRLIEFLVRRSRSEHSVLIRTSATLLGATLFIAGIPAFVYWCGILAGGTELINPALARFASWACFLLGLPWMLSAIIWQLVRGKGTPVPVVPTINFLANGPYRCVRNPMLLGFFLYLLGWVFLWNHPGCLGAALGLIAILVTEIKFIEEPELEKRFGDMYRAYKKATPFILPRIK